MIYRYPLAVSTNQCLIGTAGHWGCRKTLPYASVEKNWLPEDPERTPHSTSIQNHHALETLGLLSVVKAGSILFYDGKIK